MGSRKLRVTSASAMLVVTASCLGAVALAGSRAGGRVQSRSAPAAKVDAYRIERLLARNPAQGVNVAFGLGRAQIAGTTGQWGATLELVGYGSENGVVPVVAAEPVVFGNRVVFRHASIRGLISEWYENTPRGLEQGFTLEKPARASEQAVLEVSLRDLTPQRALRGAGLDLIDRSGATRLHYSDLSAVDATGKALKVTMSAEGNQIVLRVATRDATYPVLVDPLVWAQQGLPLTASDGTFYDTFGAAVSLSGDTALIGATSKTVGANAYQGSAYVFVRLGTNWVRQGPALVADDGMASANFGGAVSVSGDTALIGAQRQNGTGAAYAFLRTGSTWAQQGPALVASSGKANDSFGVAVSVSGDTAVVSSLFELGGDHTGASTGAAYVFARSGSIWAQQGPKLLPGDGSRYSTFGTSVALSGDTVIVGTNARSDVDSAQGGAYVFVRSGSTWSQQGPRLAASDQVHGDDFGRQVALSGDTAIVSAPAKTVGGNALQGAVYVFVRSGDVWSQQGPPLIASDGAAKDYFGSQLSISGDIVAVGAPTKAVNGNAQQGAAYVFLRSGVTWSQQSPVLVARDAKPYDAFGSVSVSGNSVIVGASQHPVGDSARGAVYAYIQGEDIGFGDPCSMDATCASGFCADGVCCEVECAGACQACSAALTGGADGTCLAIPADSDPKQGCLSDEALLASCGADGACDGAGACRAFAKRGTACGATVCDGDTVRGAACNGAGSCLESRGSCRPYACDGTKCRTDCANDADCEPNSNSCVNGTCQPRGSVGDAGPFAPDAATAPDPAAAPDSGTPGDSGAGSDSGAAGMTPDPVAAPESPTDCTSSACGCRVIGRPSSPAGLALALLTCAARLHRRRYRSP